jgi:arylsulfatase A-like enzyme
MKRTARWSIVGLVVGSLATRTALAQDVLPRPAQPFGGVIGRTATDSTPQFPADVTAPKGAPNVLLILTDDVGFGASSPFGGPIPAPTLERLAKSGLRYNQFHTTALCSPTRAALLTGRNHHVVHSGIITDMATGFPGYDSLWPRSGGTIAEVLRQNGYNTAMYGKHHNVPDWQYSSAGPFDLWPTGLGFEYFFGFIGGETNQWHPAIFENTRPVSPPAADPTYILDHDLADRAIGWIRAQKAVAPAKPFFVYYASGTAHAPHHAPKEWIGKFRGKFDQGWDQVREETFQRQKRMGIVPAGTRLTPRPKEIPAWASLSADQKKVFARMMEVYAGALAHCDYQIGRVLDAIDQLGESDNTLVIFIQGDNGASAEGTLQGMTDDIAVMSGVAEDMPYLLSMLDELGGPTTSGHYPVGWAHAMDTPFQWTKQVASHFGGTRNGMVMSWPRRIKAGGELRPQFHHVVDIVPTILESADIQFPGVLNGVAQKPLDGVSMVYSWDKAKAPSTHKTQYFEMVGNRGIYQDGWVAATTPKRLPWMIMGAATGGPDSYEWELYHVTEDFSEANNLASSNPSKLRELQGVWAEQAERYNVLPLDDRFGERGYFANRPSLTRGRRVFTYYPPLVRIPEGAAPDVTNKSYSLTADVEIPPGGASGVIATEGGHFAGWALVVLDGKPVFAYAVSNQPQHKYTVASPEALTPGRHTLRLEFAYDGGGIGKGGTGTLLVDGKRVAQQHIDRTVFGRFSIDETFDLGQDTGTPVIADYRVPATFTGTVHKVVIELAPGQLTTGDQDQLKKAEVAARQSE